MWDKRKFSSHDVARLALLMAAALILSWVEAILPFQIPVPGVKLGFANIVLLFVLYSDSFPTALCFGVLRALLSGLFLGRLSGLLFSLSGTVLAICGMALLKKCRCFSPLGVSVAGAVLHGVGQLAVAGWMLTPSVWLTLPLLGISSAACGIVTWFPFRILDRYAHRLLPNGAKSMNKD